MASHRDDLHPIEQEVLEALEQALMELEVAERYRVDIQPADSSNQAPAVLSLVASESAPIRVQVDHECQFTVYLDADERTVELYDNDPEALLSELADLVTKSIRE